MNSRHSLLREAVEKRFFKHLARDQPNERPILQNRHGVYVVAHHREFGFPDFHVGFGIDRRARHEVFGRGVGMNVAPKELEQLCFSLNQGEVLNAGGSSGCMSPASEHGSNRADVYLRDAAPGNQVDAVIHAGQGKYHVQVLDIAQLVDQHGKIAHVPVDRKPW